MSVRRVCVVLNLLTRFVAQRLNHAHRHTDDATSPANLRAPSSSSTLSSTHSSRATTHLCARITLRRRALRARRRRAAGLPPPCRCNAFAHVSRRRGRGGRQRRGRGLCAGRAGVCARAGGTQPTWRTPRFVVALNAVQRIRARSCGLARAGWRRRVGAVYTAGAAGAGRRQPRATPQACGRRYVRTCFASSS